MSGTGRVSRANMDKLDAAMLRYIAKQAPQGQAKELSLRELSKKMKVSAYRVKASSDRLIEAGLITRVAKYNDDGGRRANEFALTPKGWQKLK